MNINFLFSQLRKPGMTKRMLSLLPLLGQSVGYLPLLMKAKKRLEDLSCPVTCSWDEREVSPFGRPEEKADLLERAEWLCKQVICEPRQLIDKMPTVIGRDYQGQWAIYACSMTAAALSNLIYLYPENREVFVKRIYLLIEMVLSDEMKLYDSMMWKEDPLANLGSRKSHMTYLSILAWMIGDYKQSGGDSCFDRLYDDICDKLHRDMLSSKHYNLPSFPNGIVFIPDMLLTPVALNLHDKLCGSDYSKTIALWKECLLDNYIDSYNGLLYSRYYRNGVKKPARGSYAALTCSYLSMFDPELALQQYMLVKLRLTRQTKDGKFAGVREYLRKSPDFTFDVDAGIIVNGISPTGISFLLGAATALGDWKLRAQLLNTADLAGGTVRNAGSRHYKLAEIMLTGEAITLAMRTNVVRS